MSTDKSAIFLCRFALATAMFTVLLLTARALVTSNDAAESVPDWPPAYGKLIRPMIGGLVRHLGTKQVCTPDTGPWTLPIWLYVSITGLVIYCLLYAAYTPGASMSNRRVRFRRLSSIFLLVTAVLSAQPRNTLAQESGRASQPTDGSREGSTSVTNPLSSDSTLLNKQQPQSDPQDQKTQPLPTEESASISGIVQDVTGAAVAGAEVSLFDANGSQRRG